MECLTPCDPSDTPSMSYKIHINNLYLEYQKKKKILYGQKITKFEKISSSSFEEELLYTKALNSLKSK